MRGVLSASHAGTLVVALLIVLESAVGAVSLGVSPFATAPSGAGHSGEVPTILDVERAEIEGGSPGSGSLPNLAAAYSSHFPGIQASKTAGGVAFTIDPLNNSVLPGTFQPSFTGSGPSGGVFDSTDNRVFVGDGGTGNITVIDAATGRGISAIPTAGYPTSLAWDPSTDRVFAAGSPWTVTAINASAGAVDSPSIRVGDGPISIVYDAHDDRVLVANRYSENISIINPITERVSGSAVQLSGTPLALLYDSVDSRVFIAIASGYVLALNSSTMSLAPTNWTVGGGPDAFALDPIHDWLYVANSGSANVTVINASSGTVVARGIAVGSNPVAMLYYPATKSILVANENSGNVTVIDAFTNSASGGGIGGISFPDAIILDPGSGNVYVPNAGIVGVDLGSYVSVINPSRGPGVIRTIQIQFTFVASAWDSADGNVYVVNPTGPNGTGGYSGVNWTFHGNSSVMAVSDTTHEFLPQNFSVGNAASAIAFDSANGMLYVANEGSGSITVINPQVGIVATVALWNGSMPIGLAIDSTRDLVYVAASGTGDVGIINGTSETALPLRIPVGLAPSAILYDSFSDRLFVANCGSNNVSVIDGSSDRPIGAGISVGVCPDALGLSPTDGEIWVANEYSAGGGMSNVTVLNGSTNLAVGSVNVGFSPSSIAFDASNGYIYIANGYSNNLTAVDPQLLTTVGAGIAVNQGSHETYPVGMSYDSRTGELYVPTLFASGMYVVGNVPSSVSLSATPNLTEVGFPLAITTTVTGGNPPFSYALAGLPTPCVPVNESVEWCTPRAIGVFSLTVRIWDSRNYSSSASATLDVRAALSVFSVSVSPRVGDVNSPMDVRVGASGGVPPLTYTYFQLPPGCNSANTTNLTCAPTASGSYLVQVQVSDHLGAMAESFVSLVVSEVLGLSIVLSPPEPIHVGEGASVAAFAAGGTPPYNYVYSGLPTGCSGTNGPSVWCKPSDSGRFNISVTVTDSLGGLATAVASLVVLPGGPTGPAILAFFANPPTIVLGNSTTLVTLLGNGFSNATLAFADLPPGCLTANSSGLLCSPTTAGSFAVEVIATPAGEAPTSANASVTVLAPGGIVHPQSSTSEAPFVELLISAALCGAVGGFVGAFLYSSLKRKTKSPPAGSNT